MACECNYKRRGCREKQVKRYITCRAFKQWRERLFALIVSKLSTPLFLSWEAYLLTHPWNIWKVWGWQWSVGTPRLVSTSYEERAGNRVTLTWISIIACAIVKDLSRARNSLGMGERRRRLDAEGVCVWGLGSLFIKVLYNGLYRVMSSRILSLIQIVGSNIWIFCIYLNLTLTQLMLWKKGGRWLRHDAAQHNS